MSYPQNFPKEEHESFYIPFSISPEERERQIKQEGRRSEFQTFYFDFKYDDNGNYEMTPRPWDAEV